MTQLTQGAGSRAWSTSRTRALWLFGLAIGLIGGFATLTLSPLAALPALLFWIVVAVASPRFLGLAGALVGHGAA
jgi:hypothetical protein